MVKTIKNEQATRLKSCIAINMHAQKLALSSMLVVALITYCWANNSKQIMGDNRVGVTHPLLINTINNQLSINCLSVISYSTNALSITTKLTKMIGIVNNKGSSNTFQIN